MRRSLLFLLAFVPGAVAADDPYQVRYAANLDKGDSVLNFTNSGAMGAGAAAGTSSSTVGAICVNVYAFSPDEQMVSCCSCPVTPNGLVSLSVQRDLLSNTFTPAAPISLVIKLLASLPSAGANGCAASASSPGTQVPGLLAWATTVHTRRRPEGGDVLQATETPFSPSTLSVLPGPGDNIGELARLTQLCTFINANGLGFGVCRACQLGGLGAGRL
ncbi:MAG: hypothetical protein K2X03_17975 [Bryobacteraceae bacterium]|nr:hypothetical protein [Bryobacteraceae bacterium]